MFMRSKRPVFLFKSDNPITLIPYGGEYEIDYIRFQKFFKYTMELNFISMGDLKIHHVFTGGGISFVTYLIINLVSASYGWDSEWLVWINVGLIVVPIIFGINHKRNRNHIRRSTSICALSGHGIVFTMILYYFQEGVLPIIIENIKQIT